MNLQFISQPINGKGNPEAIGSLLLSTLKSSHYNECLFCVAFVTSGGVALLSRAISDFVTVGGSIRVYAGIGNGLTSVQGIEQLLLSGAEVYGVEAANILYHPKHYIFNGDEASWIAVGSANLTASGLFRNFETNLVASQDEKTTDIIESAKAWTKRLAGMPGLVTPCLKKNLVTLLKEGKLVDERVTRKRATKTAGTGTTAAASAKYRKAIYVKTPSLPVPETREGYFSSLSKVRRTAKKAGRTALGILDLKNVAKSSACFAMTLSAFDCSHKSGVPGTPEIAIPEAATPYFPRIKDNGRKYRDVYFPVRVNIGTAHSEIVSYRLWQRPPGTASGHADWRINIGHTTIDQTSTGGGDIILFERIDENDPPYEAWIIKPSDPRYQEVHTRCTLEVKASGAAGTKRYGLFG